MYKGYTVEQLKTAFDAVKDPTDWKAEIAVSVTGESVMPVVAAIEFYTATTPDVRLDVMTMRYYITSIGYRKGPAGDH
jgi:hypothetical protein